MTVPWLAVSLIGALVAIGELVSRYRDSPEGALKSLPGLIYLAINVAASVTAFAFIRLLRLTFGIDPVAKPDVLLWTQIIVAGFGAVAFFRTSLFTVRIADKDIGVGPSSFLQVMLTASDRSVDRVRAKRRALSNEKVVPRLSYRKCHIALPTYCLALMQNLPMDEQQLLGRSIEALDKVEIDERVKVRILILQLTNVVGPDVVAAAIEALTADIMEDPPRTE